MKKQSRLVIGFILLALLAACGGTTSTPPSATQTASATITITPTPSSTPLPTQTPTLTPTLTPTETPMPKIDLPIVMGPDGNPALTAWGTAKFETKKGFDVLPKIQDLEKQLGAPAWTPEFIKRWHAYLKQTNISGTPIVPIFDPNSVCDIKWYSHSSSNNNGSGTGLAIDSRYPCKSGTFPIVFVGAFTDNRPEIHPVDQKHALAMPLAGLTFAIYNPLNQQTEMRTFVYTQYMEPATNTFLSMSNEGSYMAPFFDVKIINYPNITYITDWFQQLEDKTGIRIYDADAVDTAFEASGLYGPGLDQTVLFGAKAGQPIRP